MENMKCVLVTKDKEYGNHMARCLRKMGTVNMTLVYWQDIEKMSDMFQFDYLLIDEENMTNDDLNKLKKLACDGATIARITANKTSDSKPSEKDQENTIWKYETLPRWISKAIKIYAKEKNIIPMNPVYLNKCKVIAVLSSGGGMGATSCAMAIASDYAYCGGKKVLYLSLKSQCQELYFSKSQKTKDLRSYLYRRYMENEELNMEDFLHQNEYGVYVFNIGNLENPIRYMNIHKAEEFLKDLISDKGFDLVVFDIGSDIWQVSRLAVSMADNKIFLVGEKEGDFEEIFMKQWDYDSKRDIKAVNFSYVGDSRFDEFFEDDEDDDGPEVAVDNKIRKIARDESAFGMVEGLRIIDLNSKFGISIRELVNVF